MILKRMHLQNYRCFESLEVIFDPRLTVFVADNGGGKTAILDAVATSLGRYLTKLPGVQGLTTKETDIRIERNERKAEFMAMACAADTQSGESISWSLVKRRDATIGRDHIKKALRPELRNVLRLGEKRLEEYALSLVAADANDEAYFLPVVAYYGTNRAILGEVKRRRGFKKEFARFDALVGALQSEARFKSAFEWFNAMEDLERREREKKRNFEYRLPELETVRRAIASLMPAGFRNPRTEIRPLRFVIDRLMSDGETRTLRLTQLSDGYRVMLGLAMDLARRMAHANGSFAENGLKIMNPLDLPAIVLIDEVDLHLHPKWQQTVLAQLMGVFRKTQFIVTTHSPQTLSTVKRESIRVIGANCEGKAIAESPMAVTYGESSGDVLQSVMMVDPQPPIGERSNIRRLTELVDQGEYDSNEATRLMKILTEELGAQHPQLQRFLRRIERQRALKK